MAVITLRYNIIKEQSEHQSSGISELGQIAKQSEVQIGMGSEGRAR